MAATTARDPAITPISSSGRRSDADESARSDMNTPAIDPCSYLPASGARIPDDRHDHTTFQPAIYILLPGSRPQNTRIHGS